MSKKKKRKDECYMCRNKVTNNSFLYMYENINDKDHAVGVTLCKRCMGRVLKFMDRIRAENEQDKNV